MDRLTLNNINEYRASKKQEISIRFEKPKKQSDQYHIMVCSSTGCQSNKSNDIRRRLKAGVEYKGLTNNVKVSRTGCFGFCEQGPNIKIMPEGVFYTQVKATDVDEIIEKHIIGKEKVERLLYKDGKKANVTTNDLAFYAKQNRIVLRNCGIINPEEINEYIANNGYAGIQKVLESMTPEQVLEELKKSGLRGRGGGGYPTWLKWNNGKNATGERKYIICNGDEGDPGAYMDSRILEGDPHAVIEAMIIGGYVIGASQGYFYIRAEYGLAIDRVRKAIDQAYEVGLLGKNILNTDFNFDLDIRLGAGAFVCGEETALIASIEGKRGTPRPRPPYPSVKGLFGMPTIINNVETLANIAQIITNGGQWFAKIGTETSKGTKVFALTGKVKLSGLIEVPMGTTINEIVFDIGGGVPDGKKAKAVQTGGPSGGVIPTQFFDTPIDYESLSNLGSMMGSGGLIVMDEDDSMVDISKFYLGFSVDESCGKCSPCRIGGFQMLRILERLSKKRGKPEDIQRLKDISLAMRQASLCGLGQTAPNPVLSTLKYFESEYTEKIKAPRVAKNNS